MEIKNLYDRAELDHVIARINNLTPESEAQWGKMNVAQMLAHNSVGFDMYFNKQNHKAPNGFMKFMLSKFLKPMLTGPKPYKKNSRTADEFIIDDERNFDQEKAILLGHFERFHELGAEHFEGAESITLGKMTAKEWNTLWSKHIDHHLTQFGA